MNSSEHRQNESETPAGSLAKQSVVAVEDAVWSALNDASRRRMLDLLRGEPMTTTQLSAHFDFSRFAVMKHLSRLHKAELIVVERRGRERINHLNPVPIQAIYRRWIRPFDELPSDRLLRLKGLVEAAGED